MSRRGRCSKMYSDNGTNFVVAQMELVNKSIPELTRDGIEWHFNLPSASHFGVQLKMSKPDGRSEVNDERIDRDTLSNRSIYEFPFHITAE